MGRTTREVLADELRIAVRVGDDERARRVVRELHLFGGATGADVARSVAKDSRPGMAETRAVGHA